MTENFPTRLGDLPAELLRLVEEVCRRFEAAWKAVPPGGQRPQIEVHLSNTPESARKVLLRELVALDVAYRRRIGEDPQPADYQKRFPTLDTEWLALELGARPEAQP